MILNVEDVSLIRDGKYILKDINWQIEKNQHWVLMGLNGSGKTMLLNMLNGYYFPSRGEIEVLGRKFGSYDLRELRKSIGLVSSALQARLHELDTALDVVLSGLAASIGLHFQPSNEQVDLALALMNQFHVSRLREHKYGTLSQGEKQIVLILRALINQPDLLILDEPCTGLDIFARENVLHSIGELVTADHAPSLIYVTHHIEEILPTFTHTLLLRAGEVFGSGLTSDLITSSSLSKFFQMPVSVEWVDDRPSLSMNK